MPNSTGFGRPVYGAVNGEQRRAEYFSASMTEAASELLMRNCEDYEKRPQYGRRRRDLPILFYMVNTPYAL